MNLKNSSRQRDLSLLRARAFSAAAAGRVYTYMKMLKSDCKVEEKESKEKERKEGRRKIASERKRENEREVYTGSKE